MNGAVPTLVIGVMLFSGCEADPKPARSDLEAVFADSGGPAGMGLPEHSAECVAKVYVESDLSSEYLSALAKGEAPEKVSEGDQEALLELSNEIAEECLTG